MSARRSRLPELASPLDAVSTSPAPDDGERDREDDAAEDAALDLPPLVPDEEPAARDDDLADLLDPLDDDGDPLDDTVARDLDMAVDLDVDEDDGAADDDAERGVDVGSLDEGLVLDEGSWSDDGGESAGEPWDEVDEVGGGGLDDGGAEGTGEAPEDAIDEGDLPALDADDEGYYEGEDLLGELSDMPDDQPPRWDASPWAVIEGAGAAVPCGALAVVGGRVVAAGSVLLVVPPGEQSASRPGLATAATSVALVEDAIIIATARGRVLQSDDGGATAAPLGAWRAAGAGPLSLATTPGRLWILAEGTLWSLAAGAGAAAPVIAASREGGVARIAASGGALLALTQARGIARLERLRGDDEGPVEIPLSGAALRAASAPGAVLAAGAQGRAVALAGGELLCVSRDGGASFWAVGGLGPVLALAFAGEDEAAPLLVLSAREGAGRAEMVRVPEGGGATQIAVIGELARGDDDEARGLGPAALAWDAARDAAWIACQAGLLAVAPKREH